MAGQGRGRENYFEIIPSIVLTLYQSVIIYKCKGKKSKKTTNGARTMMTSDMLEASIKLCGSAVKTGIEVSGFNLYYLPVRSREDQTAGDFRHFFLHQKKDGKVLQCNFETNPLEAGRPRLYLLSARLADRSQFAFEIPVEILDWVASASQQIRSAAYPLAAPVKPIAPLAAPECLECGGTVGVASHGMGCRNCQ